MKLLRLLALAVLSGLLISNASARLGETEAELIKRFGHPTGHSSHSIMTQGKILSMGPTLNFRQDDWSISCDLVDGRCMRIGYSKRGDWSEEQIQLVLNSNGQGAKWTETSKQSIARVSRTWHRIDGSTAAWTPSGMSLVWDAYNTAKARIEEREKVAAKKKPRL